jgi:hypothetical protein
MNRSKSIKAIPILPGGPGYSLSLRAYIASFLSGEPQQYVGHNPLARSSTPRQWVYRLPKKAQTNRHNRLTAMSSQIRREGSSPQPFRLPKGQEGRH